MASLTRLITLLSVASFAVAQTWTSCNPLNTTNCPKDAALGTNATFNFAAEPADSVIWNTTAGPMTYGGKGAAFTINEAGDSPTIQSTFYIFFGQVSVLLQAASGTGIVSSIVLESDDLDEVDWEFLGGNTTHVETNFFGKGNTTLYDRAVWYPLADYAADNGNGTSPQSGFHNYTTIWTAEKLEWWIDGNLVRTLLYNDSLALYGKNYPQTPCTVRMGIWSGGDPGKDAPGVIEWAGGVTDFSKAPFSMYVQEVYVMDYSTGAEYYSYGDQTGDWQSINVQQGQSTTLKELTKPHTLTQHWMALSHTTRIVIIACSIAGLVILLSLLTYYCISQGSKGRKEKAAADAEYEKEQAEFNYYRMQMMKGGFSDTNQQYAQPQDQQFNQPYNQQYARY